MKRQRLPRGLLWPRGPLRWHQVQLHRALRARVLWAHHHVVVVDRVGERCQKEQTSRPELKICIFLSRSCDLHEGAVSDLGNPHTQG